MSSKDKSTPRELVDHSGRKLPENTIFFVEPPAEIGPVVSAFSTLKPGRYDRSALVRLIRMFFRILLVGGGSIFVSLFVLAFADSLVARLSGIASLRIFLLPLLSGILFLTGWYLTRSKHYCSYVAERGVAFFSCRGPKNKITSATTLVFSSATELRNRQTRRYINGIYQGTYYSYEWTNTNGKSCLGIKGMYKSRDFALPEAGDEFHFVRAAEVAWSQYLLDSIQNSLNENGNIVFRLYGDEYVAVAPDRLEISLGGKKSFLTRPEIGSVHINQREVVIKRSDAKTGWLKSEGVFTFDYGLLANAIVFETVLNNILSVRINRT